MDRPTDYGHQERTFFFKNQKLLGLRRLIRLRFYEAFRHKNSTCLQYILVTVVNLRLTLTLMRPKKMSPPINQFQKPGLISETCGESMPMFVIVNMYVFKLCAAISGGFPKSLEIHMNFLSMLLHKKVLIVFRAVDNSLQSS